MTYLESKPRYEILDGLRGVAAIIVVLYHLVECYPSLSAIMFAHGFLAVDLFFALSGFVIGYAYDDRWSKMNLKTFFKRRITRLHPMVIFGAVVGVCFFYYSGGIELFGNVDNTLWWMLLLQALLMILMIPLPASMDIRGWGELTSINGPVWTLMFEYVANILYALFLRHLGKVALSIFVAITAIFTIDCCLRLNIFGLLVSDWNSYSVIGGFVFDPEHVYIGYTRLLYPFLVGLLLSRIYQLICILFIFPLILSIGAGSELKGQKSIRLCTFLGEISYPLYITHYPLIYMHTSWAKRYMDSPVGTHVLVAITTLLMSLAIAWGALKLYDEPVRAWLKEHWFKKS